MNKTKTTRDKERDVNHQIKRGNTQNTVGGLKPKLLETHCETRIIRLHEATHETQVKEKKRDTDNRETTGGNLSP